MPRVALAIGFRSFRYFRISVTDLSLVSSKAWGLRGIMVGAKAHTLTALLSHVMWLLQRQSGRKQSRPACLMLKVSADFLPCARLVRVQLDSVNVDTHDVDAAGTGPTFTIDIRVRRSDMVSSQQRLSALSFLRSHAAAGTAAAPAMRLASPKRPPGGPPGGAAQSAAKRSRANRAALELSCIHHLAALTAKHFDNPAIGGVNFAVFSTGEATRGCILVAMKSILRARSSPSTAASNAACPISSRIPACRAPTRFGWAASPLTSFSMAMSSAKTYAGYF